MDLYSRIFSQACFDVNKTVLKKFELLSDSDIKEKTHLFNGRYENIYLEEYKIPELEIIISTALDNAADILNLKRETLGFGFWMNAMASGDVTTAHTHDDDDELLSCVYYIKVPDKSGDLIITKNKRRINIPAKEGTFVFFSPATLHEVERNESGQSRLSIAFNFGLRKQENL